MIYGAQAAASQWAATFKDFPPIQKPNTFTLDDVEGNAQTAAACTEGLIGRGGSPPRPGNVHL